MAQNLVPKRLNIASQMVTNAKAIADAMSALEYLNEQYLQAGAYQDSDFANSSLPQLTAYLVGDFISVVMAAMQTWYVTALPSSGPVPRDIFLQMLS